MAYSNGRRVDAMNPDGRRPSRVHMNPIDVKPVGYRPAHTKGRNDDNDTLI